MTSNPHFDRDVLLVQGGVAGRITSLDRRPAIERLAGELSRDEIGAAVASLRDAPPIPRTSCVKTRHAAGFAHASAAPPRLLVGAPLALGDPHMSNRGRILSSQKNHQQ